MKQTYRFRWNNTGMQEYVEGRMEIASKIRQEVALLLARAEQIEEECRKLREGLEAVADAEDSEVTPAMLKAALTEFHQTVGYPDLSPFTAEDVVERVLMAAAAAKEASS